MADEHGERKVVTDASRRWIEGTLPSAEFFALEYEREQREVREDLGALIRRSLKAASRRTTVHGQG